MNCRVCGIPTIADREWHALPEDVRKGHAERLTLARNVGGLCQRHYSQSRRPKRTTLTNAETFAIFKEHDPGYEFTLAERFQAVSAASGVTKAALLAAYRGGAWDLTPPDPVTWPSFTHRGVTYWIKPGETRAEALRRARRWAA